MVKVTLWEDGYIGDVELLAVPRVGERVVDKNHKHYKVEIVMHLEPSDSMGALAHRLIHNEEAKPSIRLHVKEY